MVSVLGRASRNEFLSQDILFKPEIRHQSMRLSISISAQAGLVFQNPLDFFNLLAMHIWENSFARQKLVLLILQLFGLAFLMYAAHVVRKDYLLLNLLYPLNLASFIIFLVDLPHNLQFQQLLPRSFSSFSLCKALSNLKIFLVDFCSV